MPEVTIKFKGVQAGSFKVDASEITVDDGMAKEAEGLVQSVYDAAEAIEGLTGDLAAAEARADEAEGERDMLQEQGAAEVSPERLDELVRERGEVMEVAEHAGLKPAELKADTDEEVMRKIAATRTEIKEDASGDYVRGCFNTVRAEMGKLKSNRTNHLKLGLNTAPHRDAADPGADPKNFRADGEEKSHREVYEDQLKDAHLQKEERQLN